MQMTAHMVFFVVRLLNSFPAKGGVSDQYSPKTIMSGERINYKQYCLPFGTYCQVHEQDTPRNSLAARTQGAISLGPSGNVQGGHKFFALDTGKVIMRYSWTVIPMPTTVIERVNELSKEEPVQLTFEDKFGRTIGDNDSDLEVTYNDNDNGYEIPGVPREDEIIPGVLEGDTVKLTGVDMAVKQPNEAIEDTPTIFEPAVDELETIPVNEESTILEPASDDVAPVAADKVEEAATNDNSPPTIEPRW